MSKVSEIEGCNGCPMQKLFPNNVFVPVKWGKGDRLAIGEAPGENESVQGEPFVGGAGKIFDWMYSANGVKRDQLTIINVIQCRPPDNIFPTDRDARKYIDLASAEKSVWQCIKNHVLPVMETKNWKRIDIWGGKALRYIAGKFEGISKWRGSPIEIDTEKLKERARNFFS